MSGVDDFEALLAASSLGSLDARAKRARTPDVIAEEIVRRAKEARGVEGTDAPMRMTEDNETSALGRVPEQPTEKQMLIYITHIRLSAGGTKHEHITHLKWSNTVGGVGHNTREELVSQLRRGQTTARVKDSRGEVEVQVVEVVPPYLRTVADGRFTDNLLALPRF